MRWSVLLCLCDLQEYVYPDARDRQYLLFLHKGVKRTRFDIEKYNKLKDDIAEVRSLAESFFGMSNECRPHRNRAFADFTLWFAAAVHGPASVPLIHVLSLSLCLLMLCLQVELDLKRLRDPLQLQLPVQQLTASKN